MPCLQVWLLHNTSLTDQPPDRSSRKPCGGHQVSSPLLPRESATCTDFCTVLVFNLDVRPEAEKQPSALHRVATAAPFLLVLTVHRNQNNRADDAKTPE